MLSKLVDDLAHFTVEHGHNPAMITMEHKEFTKLVNELGGIAAPNGTPIFNGIPIRVFDEE